jgi:hypothetical protein
MINYDLSLIKRILRNIVIANMFFSFSSEVFKYSTEKASWYFAKLPIDIAKTIKSYKKSKLGFGSMRVMAIINQIQWKTSIFPESKSGSYLLPLKAEIRNKNNILEGGGVL